ncbi:MAG: adenylyltransferase/cytidyltransferase family protein [Muribaculaceae bacterium]|nr:adenylyltransferase/cytidyltransferase family protein [Muribaculaceae bacterium]
MTKVITYGTYDLLHEGHIRLLKRAKALGDYLIVGITADGFDLARGKINVSQSLMERIDAVKSTGLADQIIVEEYEGQKIDDVQKYGIDVFTVGSDWVGKFDYLEDYCKVIYLDRTEGISSSMIRSDYRKMRIGIIGEGTLANKFFHECQFVNGVIPSGIFTENSESLDKELREISVNSIIDLLKHSDAVYVVSMPRKHFYHCWLALTNNKHVLCESPICLRVKDYDLLQHIANEKGLVLMDGIKTAYSLAFSRMMLLIKGGIIGNIVAIDTTCTSLLDKITPFTWDSLSWWGPTAILPFSLIMGTDYKDVQMVKGMSDDNPIFALFTYGSFIYNSGVATFKVGQGVKSEGEMIISGTKGYVYVPAPWWKTDYFEIRYENPANNRRYFYQLDGEGIRHEIRCFSDLIEGKLISITVSPAQSRMIISIFEKSNYAYRLDNNT